MNETFIISIDDYDIEVIKWGETKPTFLFIHGFGGNARTFSKVIELLELKGKSALSISLPFHGNSSWPKENQLFSIASFGAALADMCEKQFGMDSYALVSHSFGSRLILWMATNRTQNVSSVHIMNPAGFYPIEIKYFSFFKDGFGARLLNYNWIAKFFTSYIIANPDQKTIDTFRWICRSYDSVCLHKTKVFIQLFKIEQEVHIYWGDKDKFLPLSFADEVKQHFKNAQVHIIERCGHLPMSLYPEKIAVLLEKF